MNGFGIGKLGIGGFGTVGMLFQKACMDFSCWRVIEGSLNRNFRQYGELKSSSRVVKSVDRRCNSQKVRRKKIHPRQMLEKSRNAVFFQ